MGYIWLLIYDCVLVKKEIQDESDLLSNAFCNIFQGQGHKSKIESLFNSELK